MVEEGLDGFGVSAAVLDVLTLLSEVDFLLEHV